MIAIIIIAVLVVVLVLIFIGAKMLASHYYTIPTEWALAAVAGLLGISILASVLFPEKTEG